jgi:hypothetical protein
MGRNGYLSFHGRSEARCRMQDAGCKMQDARCKMQDVRCKIESRRDDIIIDGEITTNKNPEGMTLL